MPVVIRNVPKGHHWGWYSREDPRMHLQTVDSEHRNLYKVWLEEAGRRVFIPQGKISRKVLDPLQTEVMNLRRHIEDRWVDLMLDQHWLQLHVALPEVTLLAYPNFPSKIIRKIDLRTWFTPEQLATLSPQIITLNREMASLRLWSDRLEEQEPYDVRLSSLLWQG